MRMYDIIEKKRDGKELSYNELDFFIKGYCEGTIPDYQAAALLMAVFIRGMSDRETADLTALMADSGEKVNLSGIKGIKVDKHSTGGVGDKTTLVLSPIVAACGVPVAKMSGRGLGHTGGTIDKLESIPGFRTSLTIDEFIGNVEKTGLAIAGQTGNLAPADKKLYYLRDVTATVNNISLIASSVMSKKVASGADCIVLDVKTGSGAFMKTIEDSIGLARTMVQIGKLMGRKTTAVVTDMDIPLGMAVGNSLEVIEAVETLKGKGPEDLRELSLELAARMLELAGKGSLAQCLELAENALKSGKALKKLEEMILNQGGNPAVIHDYSLFGKAKFTYELTADKEGFIEHIKTDSLGTVSMILGAGRETKEDRINYTAGIKLQVKTGERIDKGSLIARLYSDNEHKLEEAARVLKEAIAISDTKPSLRPLILAAVDAEGIKTF
jgi:pyrimidine-nucleoside phosphorylase